MINDSNNNLWMKRLRNYAGLLGGLLPFLSLLSAVIYSNTHYVPTEFWIRLSISDTYYVSPALTGILTAASIILMCYAGYNKIDNIITTLSGLFGIMIVIFPCNGPMAESYVGFFQLPVKLSHVIHCVSALVFFTLLAVNSMFLFTKHNGVMSDRKQIRNIIYIICGSLMCSCAICLMIPIKFNAKVWWLEMISLIAFAISWLTKGEAFPFLNDKDK